ncbi:MAG: hypothetical protein DHS20C16_03470 [Phycisphaerae bacterium]|nr:MAG: hypothetical protein DHS20C16_03470 [Phycisphaerae bacterium]
MSNIDTVLWVIGALVTINTAIIGYIVHELTALSRTVYKMQGANFTAVDAREIWKEIEQIKLNIARIERKSP